MRTLKAISITIISAMVYFVSIGEETYRLKYSATVDVLQDGKVSGSKKLKAGTIVMLQDEADDASQKDSTPVKLGKAKESEMALALFTAKRPSRGAIFKTEISLDDYYSYDFRTKKSLYWSVHINAYRPDGKDYDICYGYVKKSASFAKNLIKYIQDGNNHWAMCRLVPVATDDNDFIIEAFTPIADPKGE